MDIIAHLKADHAKLKSIFERLCQTTTRAEKTRTELLATIKHELEVHMDFEESVLYRQLKAMTNELDDELGEDLTREAYAEHACAADVLKRLTAMSPSDEMWKATMTVLKENIEHHVEEEETQLFPLARRLIDREALASMGDEYAQLKRKALMSRVEPHHQQLIGMH